MERARWLVVVGLVACSAATRAQAGPMSEYYLTAAPSGRAWVVQGDSVLRSWDLTLDERPYEMTLVVRATVRTLTEWRPPASPGVSVPPDTPVGTVPPGVSSGREYSLGGVRTGVTYPFPFDDYWFYDGAAAPQHNLTVSWSSGVVYRLDPDWSSPIALFDAGDAFEYLGIAYDASNDSLWLTKFFEGLVENRTMDGQLLSVFETNMYGVASLALDPADDTLWLSAQRNMGTFYQYSKDGTLLSTQTYPALDWENALGGEFRVVSKGGDPVPEPGTGLLVTLTLLSLTVRRQKCRIG